MKILFLNFQLCRFLNSLNKKFLVRKIKTNKKWHLTKCHLSVGLLKNRVKSQCDFIKNMAPLCRRISEPRVVPVKEKRRNPSVIARQNFDLRQKLQFSWSLISKRKRSKPILKSTVPICRFSPGSDQLCTEVHFDMIESSDKCVLFRVLYFS